MKIKINQLQIVRFISYEQILLLLLLLLLQLIQFYTRILSRARLTRENESSIIFSEIALSVCLSWNINTIIPERSIERSHEKAVFD